MGATDYTTDSKVVSGNLTVLPLDKLTIAIGGSYSISKAEFDPVIMPDPPSEVLDEIIAGDYDYSMIHTYSDLSYKHLTGTAKLNYTFSPRVSWRGELLYSKFDDDNGYVYGDETGSLYFIRTGIQYGF
jgi:hypothetical protein